MTNLTPSEINILRSALMLATRQQMKVERDPKALENTLAKYENILDKLFEMYDDARKAETL